SVATALFAAVLVGCDSGDDTTNDTAPDTAQQRSPEAHAQDIARQVTGQAESRAQEVEQQAGDAAANNEANAQELLDQAMKYISETTWAIAEQTRKQLDGMKSSLPQSMQQQIDNARQLLQTRRTAADVGGAVEGLMGNYALSRQYVTTLQF